MDHILFFNLTVLLLLKLDPIIKKEKWLVMNLVTLDLLTMAKNEFKDCLSYIFTSPSVLKYIMHFSIKILPESSDDSLSFIKKAQQKSQACINIKMR